MTSQTKTKGKITTAEYEVAVIGAGFAGLATAIRLLDEGRDSFVMFERASEVGGIWRDNTYPDCACDIQSHLYSLSRNQNPNWSQQFPPQSEILAYLQNTAARFSLFEKIRYNTEITHMEFDANTALWRLRARDGYETAARTVVLAIGILNRPRIPNIPGLDSFEGEVFHSSNWNQNYELKGKRVAIIGTGASAIQFVPHVAQAVDRMLLFQRSAPWIIPKPNRRYLRMEKFLFRTFPALLQISRNMVFWFNEVRGRALLGNKLMQIGIEAVGRFHIWWSMRNKAKREQVQPLDRFGCKRVLLSNDYFPALDRENVDIFTDPIQEIRKSSIIVQDGSEHPVDAVILGTGFVSAELYADLKIQGLNGRELLSEWQNSTGPEAYLGTTISGYPNLLMLLGPNTGLGHNSVVYMAECQVDYLSEYLKLIDEVEPGSAAYLDVRSEIQDAYNQEIKDKLAQSVWSSGCTSWYETAAGKNTAIWPEGAHRYRDRTRRVVPEHYNRVVQSNPARTMNSLKGSLA